MLSKQLRLVYISAITGALSSSCSTGLPREDTQQNGGRNAGVADSVGGTDNAGAGSSGTTIAGQPGNTSTGVGLGGAATGGVVGSSAAGGAIGASTNGTAGVGASSSLGGSSIIVSGGGATQSANGGASIGPTTAVGGASAVGGAPMTSGGSGSGGGAVSVSGGSVGVAGAIATSGGIAGASAKGVGGIAGASAIAVGGTSISLGGAATGGVIGSGGASVLLQPIAGAAGVLVASSTCNTSMNLVALAQSSPAQNWVGGDSATRADDPCGFQGSIHVGSDDGVDAIKGTADDSLRVPTFDSTSGNYRSPCSGGKCCISGVTSLYPKLSDGSYNYGAAWGASINMDLSWANGARGPYLGPATGLAIAVKLNLAQQTIRIGYRQSAELGASAVDPFAILAAGGATEGVAYVPFSAVACPTGWPATCLAPGLHPYALSLTLVGGESAGPFEVCITSVTPILQ